MKKVLSLNDIFGFKPNGPGRRDYHAYQSFSNSITNEEENLNVMVFCININKLTEYMTDFALAVALLKLAESHRQGEFISIDGSFFFSSQGEDVLKRWNEMTCRDAAMSIFHYGMTLRSIRSGLSGTPTLKATVEPSLLRSASRAFEEAFPHWELIRHAIAHRGEFWASLVELKRHAIGDEKELTFILPQLRGNEFVASARGKEVRLTIDDESVRKIQLVTDKVVSSFPTLAISLKEPDDSANG